MFLVVSIWRSWSRFLWMLSFSHVNIMDSSQGTFLPQPACSSTSNIGAEPSSSIAAASSSSQDEVVDRELHLQVDQEIQTISRNMQNIRGQLREEEEKLRKVLERAKPGLDPFTYTKMVSAALRYPAEDELGEKVPEKQDRASLSASSFVHLDAPAQEPQQKKAKTSASNIVEENIERYHAAPFVEAVQRPTLLDKPSLLKLKRFDTPTISNGLEMITTDPTYGSYGFNLEHVLDHMPDWGTMVGYAVTVKIQPSNRALVNQNLANRQKFADYVASLPADLPKIVVVEDLDVKESLKRHRRPFVYGSMWGEVNANFFVKMGARGCVCDGAVRDLPEMKAAGFRALSRTVSPSHSYGGVPLAWDTPVEVFGTVVKPGQLIAADRHGFQVIPEGDMERKILKAAEDGDAWERDFTIAASWGGEGNTFAEINSRMSDARGKFGAAKNDKYGTFEARMDDKNWWVDY